MSHKRRLRSLKGKLEIPPIDFTPEFTKRVPALPMLPTSRPIKSTMSTTATSKPRPHRRRVTSAKQRCRTRNRRHSKK